MSRHLVKACDGVDACIFSGDTLFGDETRAMLKDYLARWQRAVDQHEAEEAGAAKQSQPLPPGVAVRSYGDSGATIKGPGFSLDVAGDREEAENLVRSIAAAAVADRPASQGNRHTPTTKLVSLTMSGNLHDVARYVTEFGLSDFFVQAECSGYNSLMLLRMPIDWPADHLGRPLKAIT